MSKKNYKKDKIYENNGIENNDIKVLNEEEIIKVKNSNYKKKVNNKNKNYNNRNNYNKNKYNNNKYNNNKASNTNNKSDNNIKVLDEEDILKVKNPNYKKKVNNKNKNYNNINKTDKEKIILNEEDIIRFKENDLKDEVSGNKNNVKENDVKTTEVVNNNVINKENEIVVDDEELLIKKKKQKENNNDNLSNLKKKKLKKSVKIILLIIIIIIVLLLFVIIGSNIYKENKNKQLLLSQEKQFAVIKECYNDYVITINEADIYILDNNEFVPSFKVNGGVKLYLNDTVLDYQDEYFKIKDYDYYIHYSSVEKIDEFTINNRYKSYIVFNENVITNDSFTLYDSDGNYVFKFDKSSSFPIWIKDNKGYYVEYLDRLLFIKKEDIKEIVKENNTTLKTTDKVKTFCYHQIHKEDQKCNGSIYTCIPYKNFESHLNYLKENNYMTLTMEELELFMDKKIRVPKKTVVITLDDGARSYNAANLAQEYQTYMTYFIITGTYDTTKLVHNDYIDYQSHTDSLHKNYRCSGGYQGGLLLCAKEKVIKEDLALSQEKLGGKDKVFAFAYPFYDYNDRAIKLLKNEGFRLGFIGLGGTDGYTKQGTDKMKIKRRTVWGNHSLKDFIKFVTS